jgi:Zn-dependent oligopeptidase
VSASVASLCFAAAGAPAGAAAPALAPLPVRSDLTPEQITRSCASEIAKTKRRIDAIALQRSARTFASVIKAYENVNADFGDDLAAQTFLYQVAVDPKVRAASQPCAVAAGNVANEESARPDLYAAIVAASKSGTAVTTADKKLT